MAVKEVKYSRTFLSRTDQTDVSHHGSPEWEDFQTTNLEDERIRKIIEETFEFQQIGELRYKKMFGFDGTVLYSYRITEKGLSSRESSKNIPYQAEVHIKRAGSAERLDTISDLERFLITEGFQQSK